jgi:ribosomal protein S18 acetylase RimI-like enzyme
MQALEEPDDDISLIEELSLTAWPSLQTSYYDGWLLRFSDGYTRRANAVHPIYRSKLLTDCKIRYCEAAYRAHGLDTVFKITPLCYPSYLDEELAGRGYIEEAPTAVQAAWLDWLEVPTLDSVTLDSHLSEAWLANFARMKALPDAQLPTVRQILTTIAPDKCFITLNCGNQPAAVGMAVLDQGYLGLFDIVTDATFRNQGLARQMLLHLMGWGKANGAERAYLQVLLSNEPALHLYRKLGFRELYRYWYRVRPVA